MKLFDRTNKKGEVKMQIIQLDIDNWKFSSRYEIFWLKKKKKKKRKTRNHEGKIKKPNLIQSTVQKFPRYFARNEKSWEIKRRVFLI